VPRRRGPASAVAVDSSRLAPDHDVWSLPTEREQHMNLITDTTPAAAAVPRGGPARSAGRGRVACATDAPVTTRRWWSADDGAATAEYAIVIMAAVGFAGLLVVIMRSDEVRGVLSDLVRSALSVG
jgi:hypothetical protein